MEWEIAGLVDIWTVCISINEQILQHMMDSICNWKNIATIFINAAMDKEVLQISEYFFGIFYFISHAQLHFCG